jgi:serine/threonine protein kinase
VRPSADIWAFGVTAHQLISGRLPFEGANARSRAITAGRYAPGRARLDLTYLPERWHPVVRDCPAPDHEQRQPYDAAALLERIRAVPDDEPGVRTPQRRPRRRTLLAGLGAGLLLVAGAT